MNLASKTTLVICALTVSSLVVVAHDSPDHVVEGLTARIARDGPSTRWLMSRAYEYQSLRLWSEAAADLCAVLSLNPSSQEACIALAEVLVQQKALAEAEEVAYRALQLSGASTGRAHAILAEILTSQERWADALPEWRAALRDASPEIDWYLAEAACLHRLGQYQEQVTALESAKKRNPSIVLHRAWIRAMIDAGWLGEASKQIEQGLAESRWRAGWLLLRSRVNERRTLAADRSPSPPHLTTCLVANSCGFNHHVDAQAAFLELHGRLNSDHPDPKLVSELAESLDMMGHQEAAAGFLENTRQLGSAKAALDILDRSLRPGLSVIR